MYVFVLVFFYIVYVVYDLHNKQIKATASRADCCL